MNKDNLIDGNAVAKSIHEELTRELAGLNAPRKPCVAFIRVGELGRNSSSVIIR